MPDSLSSDGEGADPYEGQDLDGLLSGESCYVTDGLRRAVLALDALRAAPMRAELSAEAAARAYFRRVAGCAGSELSRLNAPADGARTVIAATATAGGERHLARRPHRHRRPRHHGRWPAKAIAGGVAGVVVIAGVAAFAGTRSSSVRHHSTLTLNAGAEGAGAKPTARGANSVDGSASPPPATPAAGTARQSVAELCDQYFADVTQQGQDERATEKELYQRLSSLAGGPGDVGYYCTHALQPWAEAQGPDQYRGVPGYPLPGQSQGSQGSQGAPGSQGSQGNGGAGGSGNGNGGNGNGGSGGSGNGSGDGGNVSNRGGSDSGFTSQGSQ